MAGELWRSTAEVGKEVTYGTAVVATRQVYWNNLVPIYTREPRLHRFAVGNRQNVRANTLGPAVAGFTFDQAMSADEIIELLLACIAGGITPTVQETTGRRWTFTPGNTLESMTIRFNDGANSQIASGVYVDQLRITGTVRGPNTVSVTCFAKSVVDGALTGGLTQRVPKFSEGWETKLFLNAHEGTPGATAITLFGIAWDITISNGLARKYFSDNVNQTGAITIGELSVEGTLLVEAANAQALTEKANWEAATKRLMRLQFGNNKDIAGTSTPLKELVNLDIPAAWTAVDLGQTDENTRAYQFGFSYVYDPTNAFGVRLMADNARATAW